MPFTYDPFAGDVILLSSDAPAFVRRSMNVEAAWDALLAVCQRERARLLEMPRMRLARFVVLSDLAGADPAAICRPDDLNYLLDLHREWKPRLRSPVKRAR